MDRNGRRLGGGARGSAKSLPYGTPAVAATGRIQRRTSPEPWARQWPFKSQPATPSCLRDSAATAWRRAGRLIHESTGGARERSRGR